MLTIKTYLAPDQFGGNGLFADEDIAQGQVIWRYNPDYTLYIPVDEYKSMPKQRKDEIYKYVYPVYMPDEKPPLIGVMLNLDNAKYANHADDPNTGHTPDDPDVNIALRFIKKGEEITCNYREFDPDDTIAKMGIHTGKEF